MTTTITTTTVHTTGCMLMLAFVLGMPADIRVDKDIPFNKLGKG